MILVILDEIGRCTEDTVSARLFGLGLQEEGSGSAMGFYYVCLRFL
jgi:hypothetical protein